MNKVKLVGVIVGILAILGSAWLYYEKNVSESSSNEEPIIWQSKNMTVLLEGGKSGRNRQLIDVQVELSSFNHLMISQQVLFGHNQEYHYAYLIEILEDVPIKNAAQSSLAILKGVTHIKVLNSETKFVEKDQEYIVVFNTIGTDTYNKIKLYFSNSDEAKKFLTQIKKKTS